MISRIIRLGGTSADYAIYVANQTVPALPLATEGTNYDVGGTTIGPSYWSLTSILPAAEYMIQVPLANADINETVLWAQTAVEGIASSQIHSIEIGNEPDWYSATYAGTDGDLLGPPEWQGLFTNETYVGNCESNSLGLFIHSHDGKKSRTRGIVSMKPVIPMLESSPF